MVRISTIVSLPEATIAAVLLAGTPGCGGDVALAPNARPGECPQPDGDEELSATEFVDLLDCHYPSADGWRLVRLSGSPATDGPSTGRGPWSAMVVNHEPRNVLTISFHDGAMAAKPEDEVATHACMALDATEAPDSISIILDAVARYGDPGTISLRTTHPCVVEGTCGRVVLVPNLDWVGWKTLVYDVDGTFLFDSIEVAAGCEGG